MNTVEYAIAIAGHKDVWVPACGGTEQPFISRSGIRMLYCFNPAMGKHAYIDCNTDMIMTDEEARAALAL